MHPIQGIPDKVSKSINQRPEFQTQDSKPGFQAKKLFTLIPFCRWASYRAGRPLVVSITPRGISTWWCMEATCDPPWPPRGCRAAWCWVEGLGNMAVHLWGCYYGVWVVGLGPDSARTARSSKLGFGARLRPIILSCRRDCGTVAM